MKLLIRKILFIRELRKVSFGYEKKELRKNYNEKYKKTFSIWLFTFKEYIVFKYFPTIITFL